jgi:hypothetical protein
MVRLREDEIKEYDEMKRRIEGEPKPGYRTDLKGPLPNVSEGWTQEKTASDLIVNWRIEGEKKPGGDRKTEDFQVKKFNLKTWDDFCLIYKWRNMTREVANELWIARENLREPQGGRPKKTDANASVFTWSGYINYKLHDG